MPESEHKNKDDESSRADAIIANLKAARQKRGKFGLLKLFVAIFLISIVLTVLRTFFGPTGMLRVGLTTLMFLHLFAPLCCWGVVSLVVPFISVRKRVGVICIATLCVAAIFSLTALASDFDNVTLDNLPRMMLEFSIMTMVAWAPQIACIASVWYFLFSK